MSREIPRHPSELLTFCANRSPVPKASASRSSPRLSKAGQADHGRGSPDFRITRLRNLEVPSKSKPGKTASNPPKPEVPPPYISPGTAHIAQHEFCTDPQRNPENRRGKYLETVPSRGPRARYPARRTQSNHCAAGQMVLAIADKRCNFRCSVGSYMRGLAPSSS